MTLTCHNISLEGLICFVVRHQQGPARGAKVAACFYPETMLHIQVLRVAMVSSVDTVFMLVVMGVWRQRAVNNLREARKRETTVTSTRAEVLVCVKKSEGKLVNASDSWLTKKGIK